MLNSPRCARKNEMNKFVIGTAAGALLMSLAAAGDARAQVGTGSYLLEVQGLVPSFRGFPVNLPTYMVGTFESDGAGALSAYDGALNIGGCVVIAQTGSGTLTPRTETRGTFVLNLAGTSTPTGVPGCSHQLSALPPNLSFNFEFAGTEEGRQSAIIGVSIINSATGGVVGAAWSGIGSTRLREEPDDDD
jgi:hypothetical protein